MPRRDRIGRVRPKGRSGLMDQRSYHPVGLHGGPGPLEPLTGTMDLDEMYDRMARAHYRGRLLAERARLRQAINAIEHQIAAMRG